MASEDTLAEPSAPVIVPRVDDLSAPHKAIALNCPRCGLPCPLGFGDRTACVRCGGVIPIDPGLRERRDTQRRTDRERRQRDPLWQLALRTRPRAWHKPQFLVTIAYVAPFVSAGVGYAVGIRRGDYGLAGLIWLWGIGLLHFATSTTVKGRKPELLRELLLAQPMAEAAQEGDAPSGAAPPAAPPPSTTAPPVCRVCAAPLSVPAAGAVDCSCDHCGADNLLGETPKVTPRPDLYGVQAVHREVFGDAVSQRVSNLYPFVLLLGFLGLGVLSYFAIHAPTSGLGSG